MPDATNLRPPASAIRRTILEMLHRSGASHLGPSMSVVEILNAIYARAGRERIRLHAADRDRVILSKGHAAAGLYATLWHWGLLGDCDPARDYCQDGSKLAGHASHALPGVEHSTGALGHGLSVAVGCAVGLRTSGASAARVYCVLGDGELQEGSNWEALLLARTLRLRNLRVLIDANGISSIRRTNEVIDMEPLPELLVSTGLAIQEVDGHNPDAVGDALEAAESADTASVIVCRTTKGRGVPFAEDQPIWHYRSLNEEDFRRALAALAEETGSCAKEEALCGRR